MMTMSLSGDLFPYSSPHVLHNRHRFAGVGGGAGALARGEVCGV